MVYNPLWALAAVLLVASAAEGRSLRDVEASDGTPVQVDPSAETPTLNGSSVDAPVSSNSAASGSTSTDGAQLNLSLNTEDAKVIQQLLSSLLSAETSAGSAAQIASLLQLFPQAPQLLTALENPKNSAGLSAQNLLQIISQLVQQFPQVNQLQTALGQLSTGTPQDIASQITSSTSSTLQGNQLPLADIWKKIQTFSTELQSAAQLGQQETQKDGQKQLSGTLDVTQDQPNYLFEQITNPVNRLSTNDPLQVITLAPAFPTPMKSAFEDTGNKAKESLQKGIEQAGKFVSLINLLQNVAGGASQGAVGGAFKGATDVLLKDAPKDASQKGVSVELKTNTAGQGTTQKGQVSSTQVSQTSKTTTADPLTLAFSRFPLFG